MDSNAGEFVGDERAEAWMQRIQVGEIVKIKGEELEVVEIGRREITLKLLSRYEREKLLADYGELANAESQHQRKNMLKRQK